MNRSSLAVAPQLDHLSHKRDGTFKIRVGHNKYIDVSEHHHKGLSLVSEITYASMLGALLHTSERGTSIVLADHYFGTETKQNFIELVADDRFTRLLLATVEAMQARELTFAQTVMAIYELGVKAGRMTGWRNLGEE